MKKIVTVQDISCVGKCSLTVALPIISAMGVETSVLPTAVLSTHTMFKKPAFHDLTGEIANITSHWKSIGLNFDGIYTGYLGSVEQLDLISDFIEDFRGDGFVFIDPVMGDHGKLYSGFNSEFVSRMAGFCGKADIIVPNLTEASLILNIPYVGENYNENYIKDILLGLTSSGAKKAILTGISFEPNQLGVMSYDSESGEFSSCFGEKLGGTFHGTGDIFASTCVGALANDFALKDALKIATDYTCECIRLTVGETRNKAFGVNFEKAIPMLVSAIQKHKV